MEAGLAASAGLTSQWLPRSTGAAAASPRAASRSTPASIAQAPSLSLESADGGLVAGDVAAATMAGWSRLVASASGTAAVSGVPTPHPAKDRHSAASMLGMVRVTAVSWRGVADASAMRGHGLPDAERAVVSAAEHHHPWRQGFGSSAMTQRLHA